MKAWKTSCWTNNYLSAQVNLTQSVLHECKITTAVFNSVLCSFLPDSVGDLSDTEAAGRLWPLLSTSAPHVPLLLGHKLEGLRNVCSVVRLHRLHWIKRVHVSSPPNHGRAQISVLCAEQQCDVSQNHKKKNHIHRERRVISENFDLKLSKVKWRKKKKITAVRQIHRLGVSSVLVSWTAFRKAMRTKSHWHDMNLDVFRLVSYQRRSSAGLEFTTEKKNKPASSSSSWTEKLASVTKTTFCRSIILLYLNLLIRLNWFLKSFSLLEVN